MQFAVLQKQNKMRRWIFKMMKIACAVQDSYVF